MADSGIKVYVVERSGRATYVLKYQSPATNKWVFTSSGVQVGGKRQHAEAVKMAGELEKRLRDGDVPSGRITWDAFRQQYERDHVASLSKESAAKIRSVFNKFEQAVSVRHLAEIRATNLTAFATHLRDVRKVSESTIKSNLATLRAALSWAVDQEMIPKAPKAARVTRSRKVSAKTPMKGRPLNLEEFERLIDAAPKVVGERHAPAWQRLLHGLWHSGLRLGEAVQLSWDEGAGVAVKIHEPRGKRVRVRLAFDADCHKANTDTLTSVAPAFQQFLLATPESDRRGRVFPIPRRKGGGTTVDEKWIGKVISRMGSVAGIRVSNTKTASAHDLRRSFGTRMAMGGTAVVVLKGYMRHASIETTMRYYVALDLEAAEDAEYERYERQQAQAADLSQPTAS